MTLLITEVAIQSDGTFGIAITNTSTESDFDISNTFLISEDVTGAGFTLPILGFGVPSPLPAGATITVGHSSIANLDYSNAALDFNLLNCARGVALGNGGSAVLFDSVGDLSSTNLSPDTVYASPVTRTPDTSLSDTADLSGWTVTSGFANTSLCFLADTMIATPDGERAVETLTAGDLVSTADGREVPVLWLGRQTVRRRIGMLPETRQPVRISAGALGDGLPHSDLTVTADHGMVLDGLVVNASALVNGDSIDWVPLADLPKEFVVYHVETEAHDVILANGAPSESFVDYADRRAFDNYAEYLEIHGAERIIPEAALPRVSTRRLLPPTTRARLDDARGIAMPATRKSA